MFKIRNAEQYQHWQDVLEQTKRRLAQNVEISVECPTCKRWSSEAPLTLISITPNYYLVQCSGCRTYREWDKRIAAARGWSFEEPAFMERMIARGRRLWSHRAVRPRCRD